MDIAIPDDLNISMKELIAHNVLQKVDAISERSNYASGQKNVASV